MEITCSRCGQTKPAMERVPISRRNRPAHRRADLPGLLGAVVEAADDADQSLRAQRHGSAGAQLPRRQNMEAFLFKSGAEEDVDTSKKGTIQW